MTNDVNDGKVENIQRIAFVSTAGVAFGMPTVDGKIRTAETPYGYDVSEGNISGHNGFVKFGYNGAIGTTQEYLADYLPARIALASSGAGFGIVSASAQDASTGYGIRTAKVSYLDTNYVDRSTTITLAGTTAAYATAIDAIRINQVLMLSGGTGANAFDGPCAIGLVSVVATSASTDILRQISVGQTRARSMTYCVPDGKTLYITDMSVGTVGVTAATVRVTLQANYDGNLSTAPLTYNLPLAEQIAGISGTQLHFDIPLKVGERADLRGIAYTNQSSGVPVQMSVRGWIETE